MAIPQDSDSVELAIKKKKLANIYLVTLLQKKKHSKP